MTEAKHTPGPWTLGYSDGSGGGNNAEYCSYFIVRSVPTDVVVVSGLEGERSCYGIEEYADARLIAAAPDMLEALLAEEQSSVDATNWALADRAKALRKAAISKATGAA